MQYWFGADDQVLDKEYGKPLASMVFGGAYAYSTRWTEEPRQITGINWLPITPVSSYLTQLPPQKYGVFRQANGSRTYVAYNPDESVGTVRFSDGASIEVPQRQIAKLTRPVPIKPGS